MKSKFLLSFAILLCAAITTNAQINEGRYLLGGSASFNSTEQSTSLSKTESLFSNIQFGKVIKDNTVAGVVLSYNYSNSSSGKSNQYSVGVFYRKYKPLTKNFYFFGEADAVYVHSISTNGLLLIGNNASKFSGNGGTVSFTPGISYSVCKKMQVELLMPNLLSLSYYSLKMENTSSSSSSISTSKANNFSANANLNSSLLNNFGIGFKFLLGK